MPSSVIDDACAGPLTPNNNTMMKRAIMSATTYGDVLGWRVIVLSHLDVPPRFSRNNPNAAAGVMTKPLFV